MYDMVPVGNEGNRKSFWSKPEGKTGMLFTVALLVLAGWGLVTFGPVILAAITTTIGIVAGLAVLGLFVYLVTNPQIRTGCWYLFRTFCRFFTGMVIEIDPIAILKTYLRDMRDKKRELDEKRGMVKASLVEVNNQIQQKKRDIEDCSIKLKVAKERGFNEAQIASLSTRAGLTDEMIRRLLPYQQNLTVIDATLTRMSKAADVVIAQTATTVELKEEEYKLIKRASGAVKSAVSIFNGDPDKRDMFDQAMEYINDDIALKVGEMSRAIEDSSTLLDNIDLSNLAASEKGKKILENFNPDNYTILQVADESGSYGDYSKKEPEPVPVLAAKPKSRYSIN